jgi:protein TonB
MVSAATKTVSTRSRYGVYLRNSILATLALHFLLFYFFPAFEFKPYELPEMEEFELVIPDIIEVPPPPEEITQPQPEIIPSDDGVSADDIDIAPNVFPEFKDIPKLRDPQVEHSQSFYVFEEAPELITSVKPIYPELAMNAGIEGTVMLRVLVGEDGKVLSVDVLRSDVTPAMEEAAMVAARQFRFKPARQRTVPVRAYMAVPVEFRLR